MRGEVVSVRFSLSRREVSWSFTCTTGKVTREETVLVQVTAGGAGVVGSTGAGAAGAGTAGRAG